jgi:hypothetical protein
VLTRDASATVVGYVEGVRQISFSDVGGLAIVDANDTLRFFTDDSTTDGEEDSGGTVSRIRLYDGPLTGNEVAGLACEEFGGAKCALSRAEYAAEADAICQAATSRFDAVVRRLDPGDVQDLTAFSEAAIRSSEDALAVLYALPPPEADRALLEGDYRLRERELGFLRRIAVAASAGDAALAESLSTERIDLTHQRVIDVPGHLPWGCPVALGA